MRSPRTSLTAAAAALVLTAVPALAQQSADVEVVDSAFAPGEVTVDAGGTVTWTQTGSLPHSVTADDGSFDSHPDCGSGDCMQNGDTFSHTFTEPGEYAYYCRIHGGPGGAGMSGTVVVTAASQTEQPTDEPTDGAITDDTVTDDDPATGEDAGDTGGLPETGTALALLGLLAALLLLLGGLSMRRGRSS